MGRSSASFRVEPSASAIVANVVLALVAAVAVALAAWTIVRALTRGHGVAIAVGWIVAIVALPFVGALAFLLFASPSVKRIRLKKRRAAARVRGWVCVDGHDRRDHEAAESLVDLAVALTGIAPTTGNAVTLLGDDGPTFERIEAAIRGARRFVWAEYYLIRNDVTGRRFLALLTERARAGVEVRLLYDAIGSMWLDVKRLRELAASGGLARAFQPMSPLRRRLSVNLRNHRKLVVVDGVVGFTGGMNMGDEYSSRRRLRRDASACFRDSHLELRGPAVGSLAQTFAEDWAFAGGEPLDVGCAAPAVNANGALVAIVPSGPDQEYNASAMVHFAGIVAARRRVDLTSPYFVPDTKTTTALVSAALRKVVVRVLVPQLARTDVKLASLAARSCYRELLRSGVRIFEYQPSMLHTKTLLVDEQVAYVGSANVDVRSFRLNFEIGALIDDPELLVALEARFADDLRNAREVTLADVARTPLVTRAGCALARTIAPIL